MCSGAGTEKTDLWNWIMMMKKNIKEVVMNWIVFMFVYAMSTLSTLFVCHHHQEREKEVIKRRYNTCAWVNKTRRFLRCVWCTDEKCVWTKLLWCFVPWFDPRIQLLAAAAAAAAAAAVTTCDVDVVYADAGVG